jgi:hypothetical protein
VTGNEHPPGWFVIVMTMILCGIALAGTVTLTFAAISGINHWLGG